MYLAISIKIDTGFLQALYSERVNYSQPAHRYPYNTTRWTHWPNRDDSTASSTLGHGSFQRC